MGKRLLIAVILALTWSAGLCGDISVAVLNFDNNSLFQKQDYSPLKRGLAEIVSTTLSNVSGLQLVERRRLDAIFDELKLSQSGMLSEMDGVEVGKLAGAQYLVFGSFMAGSKKRIRIDTRIVCVETGLTVKAEEVTGKQGRVLSLADKLCRKIVKNLSESFDNVNMEAAGRPRDIDFKALLYFSRGLDFTASGDTAAAVKEYRRSLQEEPSFILAKERLNSILKAE